MINISKRCMDFLRSFVRGADDVLNNPAASPEKAAEAVSEAMIRATEYQGLRQSIGSVIRNFFLLNLGTAAKNFIGNMGRVLEVPTARLAAGKPREAADILIGYSKAFNKVFPRFIGGFRNIDIEVDTVHMRKFDIARGVFKANPSETVDKFVNRPINAFVTFAQNLQRGVDEGFATLFEHAQLEVMLNRIKRNLSDNEYVRKFISEKGVSPEQFIEQIRDSIRLGEEAAIAAAKREGRWAQLDPIWKYVKEVSPELMSEIEEFSRYGTFRSKLGSSMIDQAAMSVSNFVNKNPEFSTVLPFIITPTNIAKFGGGYIPILGMVRYRQGLKDIQVLKNQIQKLNEKLAKAKSPEAAKKISDRIDKVQGEINFKTDLNRDFLGQQVLGIGLIGTAYAMVKSNTMTGAYPADPGRRNAMMEAGIPEFSVKIGDRWVSYAGIEPLHTILAMTANSFDTLQQAKIKGEDPVAIGIDIGNTIKSAFVDKTFTQQLSDMLLALQEPDRLNSFIVSTTNGLLPSGLYQISRAMDPIKRDVRDPELFAWIINNLKQRIPGVRETLPARYNMLGEPAKVGSLGSIVTGVKVEPATQNEIQMALSNPNMKLRPPSRNLYGVELTGEQYSQMTRIMGELTNTMLGNMVSNPGFKAMPEYTQAFYVAGLVSEIRSNVRLAMINQLNLSQEQKNDMIRKEFLKRGINPVEVGIEID